MVSFALPFFLCKQNLKYKLKFSKKKKKKTTREGMQGEKKKLSFSMIS